MSAADWLEEPGQVAAEQAEQAGNQPILMVGWQGVAAPVAAVGILPVADEAGTLPRQV